jgi:diguanylate cyclase (GGDEF)-like protein
MAHVPAELAFGPAALTPVGHSAPVEAVVLLDERDYIAWASPSIRALTGWSADELTGTPGLELVHVEDRGALARLLADMRGSPTALSMTLRIVTARNEPVPVEAEATNLVDEPGLDTVSLTFRLLSRGSPPPRRRRRQDHPQTVLDSLEEGVLVVLADGTVLSCNQAAPALLGIPRSELVGHRLGEAMVAGLGPGGEIIDAEGRPVEPGPEGQDRQGDVWQGQALVSLADEGSEIVRGHRRAREGPRWLRFHVTRIGPQRSGEAVHLLVSVTDITALRRADDERRAALAELAEEREFLAALVGNLEAGVVACDASGATTVTNPMFRLFGDYRPDQVAAGTQPTVVGMHWPDGVALAPHEHPLHQALRGVRVSQEQIVFRPPTGAPERVVETSATVLRSEDGRLLGAVAGFQDVTEASERARELTELALHDPLTGCANRLLLSDRVALAADFAGREKTFVGLLVIDLDDFKLVNDTHGHLVGDEVLVGVARRLRSVVRPGDTVARYGGDEFVVLCQIGGGADELESVRERIESRLSEPFRIGSLTLPVGASVGSALLPGTDAELSKLLRAADSEMYEQKLSRSRPEARLPLT